MTSTHLLYKKRPTDLMTYVLGFTGMSNHFDSQKAFPEIVAKWNNITIDKKHLGRFNKMCQVANTGSLSLIYPFTLSYPLLQRILGRKEAPLSMFKVLNTRMQVLQHREIGIDENLSFECKIVDHRILPKGLEMDILTLVTSDGELVWENIQTFYFRGRFDKADDSYTFPALAPIPDAETNAEWFLSEKAGRGFARISGDGNPIHQIKMWARLFGFERDFAQPMLILANAIERMKHIEMKNRIFMEVFLKGQIYYERNVILKGIENQNSTRFDLYCQGNDRPCICGEISSKNRNRSLLEKIIAA